jgi:hypothetical protein
MCTKPGGREILKRFLSYLVVFLFILFSLFLYHVYINKEISSENNPRPTPTMKVSTPLHVSGPDAIFSDLLLMTQTLREYKTTTNIRKKVELQHLLFPWVYKAPGFEKSWEGMINKTSGDGRGIVICLNDKYYRHVATLLSSLQRVGCKLPIQFFYDDLSPPKVEFLKKNLNHTFTHFSEVYSRDLNVSGWDLKAFAMLASSFDEPIIVDADVVFFQNPELLYDHESYTKFGTVFFYDRVWPYAGGAQRHQEWLATIIPPPYSETLVKSDWYTGATGFQLESGVVVFDKTRHHFALLAICNLNLPIPSAILFPDAKVYNENKQVRLWGDKERFWLGMDMVEELYAYYPTPAGSSGVMNSNKELCGTVTHVDTENRVFWINDGILKDKNLWDSPMQELTYYSVTNYKGRCHVPPFLEYSKDEKEMMRLMFADYWVWLNRTWWFYHDPPNVTYVSQ